MTSGAGSEIALLNTSHHRRVRPRMVARSESAWRLRLAVFALLVSQLGCESKTDANSEDSSGDPAGDAAGGASASGNGDAWPSPDVTQEDGPTVESPCDSCLPEGRDYFSDVWNVSFDYEVPYDFTWESGIEDLRFDSGWLRGTIADVEDPQLFLLFAGIHGNVNWGQGQDRPIDSTRFMRLSYRICLETTQENPMSLVYWYRDGPTGHSDFEPLDTGCHIHAHDLSSYDTWAETGEQHGLRFDLNNVDVGDEFALDWVRLTVPAASATAVRWADVSTEATKLGLYIDEDDSGWDGDLAIVIAQPEESGELHWGENSPDTETRIFPSDLPPGEYHLYWQDEHGSSRKYIDEPLVINRAPLLTFSNPTKTSGLSYAEEHQSPWDLTEEGAGGAVKNCPAVFENGEVSVVCSSADPQFQFSIDEPIDTSYYRYLTLDVWSQHAFRSSSVGGGMMRVLWGPDGGTSEDILISHAERWTTHTFDLQEMNAEGRVPTGWTNENWTWLRFDPNENTNGTEWEWRLRNPELTGPPLAGDSIELSWTTNNESEPVLVILSYASSPDGTGSEELARFVSEAAEDRFLWDTTEVLPGDYTLRACLFDGLQTRCTIADAPVRVASEN